MRISELTDLQKEQIKEALLNDGFVNVQIHNTYISYTKGYRDFELYSLDLEAEYNTDDFLNIILRESEFFASYKNEASHLLEESIALQHEIIAHEKQAKGNMLEDVRIRHTKSLAHKISEQNSVDEAIASIPGWNLVNTESLKDINKFYTECVSTELKHILIKSKDHIAINHGPDNHFIVYELSPDVLMAVICEHPEGFVMTPNFVRVAKEINQSKKD